MTININQKIQHFVEKYGEQMNVTEEDFEKAPLTDKERMDGLEDCILELAEIIGGVE